MSNEMLRYGLGERPESQTLSSPSEASSSKCESLDDDNDDDENPQNIVVSDTVSADRQSLEMESSAATAANESPENLVVSLSKILRGSSTSTKLLVAFQLAKAIPMSHGVSWFNRGWNQQMIHCRISPRSRVLNETFVDDGWLESDTDGPVVGNDQITLAQSKEQGESEPVIFPAVLALGVTLLEICLGINTEDHYQSESQSSRGTFSPSGLESSRNAALIVLSKTDLSAKGDTFGYLEGLIDGCLRGYLFMPLSSPKNIDISWKELVGQPLEMLYLQARILEASGSTDSRVIEMGPDADAVYGQLEPPSSGRLTTETPIGGSHATSFPVEAFFEDSTAWENCSSMFPSTLSDEHLLEVITIIGEMSERRATSSALGLEHLWLEKLQKFNFITQPPQADPGAPVKIAILDTGIRLQLLGSRGLADHKNFANGISIHDVTGRGSSAIQLLLRVHRQPPRDSSSVVFPASLYAAGQVMCMFAADENARHVAAMNPTPIPSARHNFAILGDGVDLGGAGRPLAGTALSAVLGAALAGRIIHFSRDPHWRECLGEQDVTTLQARLSTVEGMTSVFDKMAVQDDYFKCIVPWKILPPMNNKDLLSDEKREEVRRYIMDVILAAVLGDR
ncbi:extracellular alkaline serine protease [Colletotrichum musicola]|uniref:Extracellular alkaline serine protease n=1 Tax=Colletotrichum musicola TaxID=2175873 RepID=A0A8H6K192_9PEZI|nr:extracellular alkaline serine protease [Colletotrichum musicola]